MLSKDGSSTCTFGAVWVSGLQRGGGSHQRNFIGDMYNYAVFDMKPTYNTKSSSQVSSNTY